MNCWLWRPGNNEGQPRKVDFVGCYGILATATIDELGNSMKIQPRDHAGAEIADVDLRALTENQFEALAQAFALYGLLFFRDQNLSEADHIQFAERWGPINVNRFFKAHANFPEIALVEKTPEQEMNIGGGWHTDHSYDEIPALGSILVARVLPPTGGDTWFISVADAFDRLDSQLQMRLQTLTATHSGKHVFGEAAAYMQAGQLTGRFNSPEKADAMSDPVHPVVIAHPLSSRATLYVNPAFTLRINELSEADSAAMLETLYAEMSDERHVERFDWQPGSIAFWDNRATWHYAQNDYPGFARSMHRITIEGQPLHAFAKN